jgi:TRAP-type transport system periplasmic protein
MRSRQEKTIRALGLAGVVAAGIGICGSALGQGVEIQAGTTSPPGNVQEISLSEFAKRVGERIGDWGRVEVYHSSQLGGDTDMLQKVRLGTQDISQPSTIMSTVLPEFGLFEMPYLVRDREHMRCIAEQIVWPEFAPKLEARGIKLIGVWENGIRHITNNVRPIDKPEDLNGIKLRTPRGAWRIKMFETYGANPSPMSFSELFVALQTGVMDGQENPYVNIEAGRLNEVQKYLSETGHVYTPSFPVVSLQRFNRYPEDVQQAIVEEGRDLMSWVHELAERMDEEVKQKLIAAGMPFKGVFAGDGVTGFFRGAIHISEGNHILHDLHNVPALVVWLPFVMMVLNCL